jgi:CheY-like chemotaxis protein
VGAYDVIILDVHMPKVRLAAAVCVNSTFTCDIVNSTAVCLYCFADMTYHFVLGTALFQMGGKEAAAEIRKLCSQVPIIFLTGETAESMHECTRRSAPATLLLKPCTKLSLITVSL